MIWFIFICVLIIAFSCFLLRQADENTASPTDHYRLQLSELEEDRARGLLTDDMFAAAKLEIDRRLIRANMKKSNSSQQKLKKIKPTILILGGITFIGALSFYLVVGNPYVPAQPAKRLELGDRPITEDGPTMLEARRQIEARLKEAPDDEQGWSLLSSTARAMGEYDKTIAAYDRLIALNSDNADWHIKKYEAFVEMASGQITPAARLALINLVSAFPDHPAGQFYLGQVYLQNGDQTRAADVWRALLARSSENAPWVPTIKAQLAQIESAPPQISADDVENIAALDADEQMAFIKSMVARLETRLKENPADLEGWERLANAYITLGNNDNAIRILNEALTLVDPADQKKLQAILDKLARKTNS